MIAIRIGVGFVAGVLGYVVFHQGAVALFHALGVFPTGAFPTRAVPFLGITALQVPLFVSLGFWAGLWGIVIALVVARIHSNAAKLVVATLIGAIGATAYGWFVVSPWRGQPIPPIAANWNPAALWRGPLINGIFGLGAGIMLRLLLGFVRGRR
ncbi:MAG: hypothetical protein JNK67_17885 [Alphaproteobacteria bacterium]|nr:hypothetical protein [Alphaproteobacteria bacterium]